MAKSKGNESKGIAFGISMMSSSAGVAATIDSVMSGNVPAAAISGAFATAALLMTSYFAMYEVVDRWVLPSLPNHHTAQTPVPQPEEQAGPR